MRIHEIRFIIPPLDYDLFIFTQKGMQKGFGKYCFRATLTELKKETFVYLFSGIFGKLLKNFHIIIATVKQLSC